MTKAAILLVNPQLLADLLNLPDGARIDAITQDIEEPYLFKIRVIGAGWEVAPGQVIPQATATCDRDGPEWNFPK